MRNRIAGRATIALCVLSFATAGAQQKFTTQILLVPVFRGPDRGLASKASQVVRGRVGGAFPRSELRVVSTRDANAWLHLSGFEDDVELHDGELKELARKFRADEQITGIVTRSPQQVRVEADLTLTRDLRLSQPLVGEGPTVTDAAEAVAREAIAARRQLAPLRDCENLLRDGKAANAATAATAGIAAYAPAVPARLCLLNALIASDAGPDTLIAVAGAVLAIAPANPIALSDIAGAYDTKRDAASAAPMWVRLMATDTIGEDLVARVVNALAREGNARIGQPFIDRATGQHPDNLSLLKLRWLIHWASEDWKGAIESGEQLLARDAGSSGDPAFYARLASAYKSDSQPTRALATGAMGVAKFPDDVPLYITYLQLLRDESEVALPRGLTAFPENSEIHVLAAQRLKSSGNAAGALAETKRALEANPRLPHGYLQLAQLEIDVGEIDSAYAATAQATSFGEHEATVAQFALARGDALYKAANASQKRDDFQRAIRFLALAARTGQAPEAKFLLGASSLSVSMSASKEAPATKSCELSRLADTSLTDAQTNLTYGGSVAPDATKQYLDYAAKLRPFIDDQVRSYC